MDLRTDVRYGVPEPKRAAPLGFAGFDEAVFARDGLKILKCLHAHTDSPFVPFVFFRIIRPAVLKPDRRAAKFPARALADENGQKTAERARRDIPLALGP
jgi:hypothetical protein